MTERTPLGQMGVNITSSVIVALIVAGVAYFGTSSSISGTVGIRLMTIENEVAGIRKEIKEMNAKRVSDLEDEVRGLKAEVSVLREVLRRERATP